MYIDDFIWLPDILEKLAVKHHVTRTRWRKCFSIGHDIALSSLDIDHLKTCIQPSDRRMRAVT
jgi:hypothetical protein